MKNPNIIREGDIVRVVIPSIIVRVGYPRSIESYISEAEEKYQKSLLGDMDERCAEKVINQIAYGLAKQDGFGGRERTVHLQSEPDLTGAEFTVQSTRMVQTGTYCPPCAPRSYFGELEYEPGGLENMKYRRLASGNYFGFSHFEIPVEHLEKVKS